jgi:hypothetical protein
MEKEILDLIKQYEERIDKIKSTYGDKDVVAISDLTPDAKECQVLGNVILQLRWVLMMTRQKRIDEILPDTEWIKEHAPELDYNNPFAPRNMSFYYGGAKDILNEVKKRLRNSKL